MAIRVVTPPAVAPVSREEIKAYLRIVDSTDDDALLDSLIAGVSSNLSGPDGWLGRSLVEQTLELNLDRFPCNELLLPFGPVQSVVSVKYDDDDGTEATFAVSGYDVDILQDEGGWILPVDGWPSTYEAVNAVRVQYVAGYPLLSGDEPSTPEAIKTAIQMLVAHLFAHPEAVGASMEEMPLGAKYLLQPFRIYR